MVVIPIPIGTKHTVVARGTSWKLVSCENCREPYAYLFDVEARGTELDLLFLDSAGSRERAAAQAQHNLAAKIAHAVAAIPCPQCGFFQSDMARQLKEDAWINSTQVGGVIAAVASWIPLAFDAPFGWLIAAAGTVAGALLMAYGYLISMRYDPNAGDPSARIEIGRRTAVWGERLGELMKEGKP